MKQTNKNRPPQDRFPCDDEQPDNGSVTTQENN